jgi:hypothetical protein
MTFLPLRHILGLMVPRKVPAGIQNSEDIPRGGYRDTRPKSRENEPCRIGIVGEAGDLGRVLADSGYTYSLDENLDSLIGSMPSGGALFALAGEYPVPTLKVSAAVLKAAKTKGIKLFLEYPAALEGLEFKAPRSIAYERSVICFDGIAGLPAGSILMPCGSFFLPCEAAKPLILLARVAGYDKIAFGLPEKVYPLLFPLNGDDSVLVASGCLSRFITARAAPFLGYRSLWRWLLKWATGGEIAIDWKPAAGPAYGPGETLPSGAEDQAISRNIRWFLNHAVYRTEYEQKMFEDRPGGEEKNPDEIAKDTMLGGVLEGYESGIDHNGRQRIKTLLRGDCIGETAMVMALNAVATGNPETRKVAIDASDYVFSNLFFHHDPTSPLYGLNDWFRHGPIFYADDNARVILGVLTVRSLLGIKRWDERLLKCTLANLRTAARTGFRRTLSAKDFEGKSWAFYNDDTELVSYAPHYQAYIWAVYLWMYALTGYEPLYRKSVTALSMCMKEYPRGWKWTNSLTAEMTRILLPLSILARIDDKAEYRQWLRKMADQVAACIKPCGAIADMFGDISMGKYPPPQSNESYGTTEASLIQENGDPATDLLYTANWAYLGLHEAAITLEDEKLSALVDRMTDFFCRIQVRSAAHPYLDGCWMRSFDFEKWEYWGSSADTGWGAWCVESGWVNTWICSVMAMRQRKRSLFDLSARDDFAAIAPGIIREMETDNTGLAGPGKRNSKELA